MNSVVLCYEGGGLFKAIITVAAGWTITGVWISGGGNANVPMQGTFPATGAGSYNYTYNRPPTPPPSPPPGVYTATAAFQQMQQQTAQGQCQV